MRANAHQADRDLAGTELYRGSELVPEARDRGTWDGVVLPYVPAPFGDEVAGLPLSRETDTDIDPVTYQVLRWRLWNINLEHDNTIRLVCGTGIVCHALDYNTSMLVEDGRTILGRPSLQRFVGQGDLSVRYTMAYRHPNPGISPGDYPASPSRTWSGPRAASTSALSWPIENDREARPPAVPAQSVYPLIP